MLQQASEPLLNLKTLPLRGPRCSARHQKNKVPHSQTERWVKWQRTTVISECRRRRRSCAACLCQQKWLKYTPMNMRFLYEEFDNKGPTTSFLMRLDCLCLCVCVCLGACVCSDRQVSTTLSYLHV